jgi:hypothetical protein
MKTCESNLHPSETIKHDSSSCPLCAAMRIIQAQNKQRSIDMGTIEGLNISLDSLRKAHNRPSGIEPSVNSAYRPY